MISAFEKAQLISYLTGEDLNKVRLYGSDIAFDANELQKLLARFENGETVARITGKRWFWKNEFYIKNTLEPRADSETLIEAVLKNFPDKNAPLQILDIGAGSGCLLLSLLGEYEKSCGVGIDTSTEALATAIKNSQNLGIDNRAKFIEQCLFENIPQENIDIIISNPPYIKTDDIPSLDKNVRDFDPYQSLDGGADGLDPYRAILKQANIGHIFFEIGQGQEIDIEKIAQQYNYVLKESYKDLGDIIRVLYFIKTA